MAREAVKLARSHGAGRNEVNIGARTWAISTAWVGLDSTAGADMLEATVIEPGGRIASAPASFRFSGRMRGRFDVGVRLIPRSRARRRSWG